MLIRFINFLFHIYSITLFSTKKSDVNKHTLQNTLIELLLKSKHQQEILYADVASLLAEAATGGVLSKNVFLKILEILQENICIEVSFNKIARLGLA